MAQNAETEDAEESTGTDRVMLDIETLGIERGAAILSIGAVRFDADGVSEDTFHRSISLKSCQNVGLEVDAETLEWWLDQDESVRDVLTGGESIRSVLVDFGAWCEDADEVWANSPAFDCEVLEAAYDAIHVDSPWAYYEERCYRTLSEVVDVDEPEQEGEEHDALDDAVHQARVASRALRELGDEAGGSDA